MNLRIGCRGRRARGPSYLVGGCFLGQAAFLAAWAEVEAFSDLRVIQPDTLAVPAHRTSIRLFYTERGVYVSFDMEQPPETLLRRYTARDSFDAKRDSAVRRGAVLEGVQQESEAIGGAFRTEAQKPKDLGL